MHKTYINNRSLSQAVPVQPNEYLLDAIVHISQALQKCRPTSLHFGILQAENCGQRKCGSPIGMSEPVSRGCLQDTSSLGHLCHSQTCWRRNFSQEERSVVVIQPLDKGGRQARVGDMVRLRLAQEARHRRHAHHACELRGGQTCQLGDVANRYAFSDRYVGQDLELGHPCEARNQLALRNRMACQST